MVWIQHSDYELAHGSDGWQIVSALAPGAAEPLVEKNYGDAFEDTTLVTVLFRAGCRATGGGRRADRLVRPLHAHGALARGYDATLVGDAHTTEDQTDWEAPPPDRVIAHRNLYWAHQTAPGRTTGTVDSKDVDFGGPIIRKRAGDRRRTARCTDHRRQLH